MPIPTNIAVFKPRFYSCGLGVVGMFFGLIFVAAGLACFFAVGLHPFSFAFTGLGLIAVAACISVTTTRVIITPAGMEKRWSVSRFTVRWDDVDSWSMIAPSDDPHSVKLRLCGGKKLRFVFDYEVENPGFEEFLAQMRQYAAEKEAVQSRAA
jgi:hypothetical protein